MRSALPSLIAVTLGALAFLPAARSGEVSGGKAEPGAAVNGAAEFTGIYAISDRNRFTVVLDGEGGLQVRLTGQGFHPIAEAGKDRFALAGGGGEFQFTRNAAGKVEALKFCQSYRATLARRTGERPPVVIFLGGRDLAGYEGRFQVTATMLLEVTVQDEQLYARLPGQPVLPIFCDAKDHFGFEGQGMMLRFERDSLGDVSGVTLVQGGREMTAPRVTGK